MVKNIKLSYGIALLFTLLINNITIHAQNKFHLSLNEAKFKIGDDPVWKNASYDDSNWENQKLGEIWEQQGHAGYDGYAWYRIHIIIPSSLKNKAYWKDSLRISLANVDDVDQTFLNGVEIGHTGKFPYKKNGYESQWAAGRKYTVPLQNKLIKWDKDNVIAVRVYDGGGEGGIFMGKPFIDVLERINGLKMTMNNDDIRYESAKKAKATLHLKNHFNTTISGQFTYAIYDAEIGRDIISHSNKLELNPLEKKTITLNVPQKQGIIIKTDFTENGSGLHLDENKPFPYILTRETSPRPRINGASIFGVRPGHPILYKIPATGETPLTYAIEDLPKGLNVNASNGVISGVLSDTGTYQLHLVVENKLGKAYKQFTLKVGNEIALTPAMGWNSWNCWGLSVSDEKVKSSAQAMIDKGLINHGWSYINIDDGWQDPKRTANGAIMANSKFPDMHALGNFLHSNGLKFGIYSSPGPKTCGGFLGSYRHVLQDAKSYEKWGVDYLKYDWCSYSEVVGDAQDLPTLQKPYIEMRTALDSLNRDIYYSLCQYGWGDVWKWGHQVGGNSWRTTGDITDNWNSLYNIGFSQNKEAAYGHTGGWNDPDMLIVGKVGWGADLHPTGLSPDEQYTHISLWCLLSAPLLIGCDLSKLDKFTLNLLTNDDVIAVDQDELGQSAKRMIIDDSVQVWVKNLANGSKAIGIFNTSETYKKYFLKWRNISLNNTSYKVRDLWRQKDDGIKMEGVNCELPGHGVFLIRVQ